MSQIKITINTDNAAFEDYNLEVPHILRTIAEKIRNGNRPTTAHDTNGNRVGTVEYVEDQEEE